MTILRAQSQIADASTADLIETYNALTGKSISRFSSRGAGESQVANAIMAAQDRAGHLGVAKGAAPVAMTVDEAKAKKAVGTAESAAPVVGAGLTGLLSQAANAIMAAQAKAKKAAGAAESAAPVGSPRPLREKLALAAGTALPNKAKPKAERADSTSRGAKLTAVVPTGAGASKLQTASERAAVFTYIVSTHAKTNAPVTIAALDEHFARDTRGFVGKLLEKNHLAAAE